MDHKVLLGVAATRRFIFSKEDAQKYKNLTLEKLKEMGVNFIDMEDVNEEGMLRPNEDISGVVEKFKRAKVDAVFFPHANFGTEDIVCKVAKELGVPVLLWGPRDEAPLADGSRLRDTQCGLFATGKVFRRMNIPFTYIPNSRLEDAVFERGVRNFIAAVNVVKEFKKCKILQISTRPADFWTMMCNEGELLERYNIQLLPVPLPDVIDEVLRLEKTEDPEVLATIATIYEKMNVKVPEKSVKRLASLKCAMKNFALSNGCNAIAIQCWNALQRQLQIHPCVANALLTDEGIPVACETDIHGAITAVMVQAAGMGKTPSFFADWSVRHPENPNGELLQHCGPWPLSLAVDKPMLSGPFAFDDHFPGAVFAEIRGGEMTLARFDADHGEYSLLLGPARGIPGPSTAGTYVWIEVDNWVELEDKLVTGPYVHHCVGIHGDVTPVLYEACKYIGLKPDFFYDGQETTVKRWLRGEI